jgi:hypothetical protein
MRKEIFMIVFTLKDIIGLILVGIIILVFIWFGINVLVLSVKEKFKKIFNKKTK